MVMTTEVTGKAMLTLIFGGQHTEPVTKMMGLSGNNYIVWG